jgi:AcrR family transcriptional regulator
VRNTNAIDTMDETTGAEEWMATGVLPAAQRRSRERRDRLLSAGLELIADRSIDDIGIAEITAAAGYSVGSFYRRFTNKEGYVMALQDIVLSEFTARARGEFAGSAWQGVARQRVVESAVEFLVDENRRARGLIETALKTAASERTTWAPYYASRHAFYELLRRLLEPHVPADRHADPRLAVAFAIQTIFAVLNQVTSLRTGAIRIDDGRLVDEVSRMCCDYLGFAQDT